MAVDTRASAFQTAQRRFDAAADIIGLDDDARQTLREVKRELTVHFDPTGGWKWASRRSAALYFEISGNDKGDAILLLQCRWPYATPQEFSGFHLVLMGPVC